MKYSQRLTLEIKMKDFYKYATSRVDTKTLHKEIRNELYHCWNGIVNGTNGGEACDWTEQFYYNLWLEGYIEQTQEGKDTYGDFNR